MHVNKDLVDRIMNEQINEKFKFFIVIVQQGKTTIFEWMTEWVNKCIN